MHDRIDFGLYVLLLKFVVYFDWQSCSA